MINTTLAITIHGEQIINETSLSYCQDKSYNIDGDRIERYIASNSISYWVDIAYETTYTITITVNDYKGYNFRSNILITQDPTPIDEEPDDPPLFIIILLMVSMLVMFFSGLLIVITQVIYFFHRLIRKTPHQEKGKLLIKRSKTSHQEKEKGEIGPLESFEIRLFIVTRNCMPY